MLYRQKKQLRQRLLWLAFAFIEAGGALCRMDSDKQRFPVIAKLSKARNKLPDSLRCGDGADDVRRNGLL